MLKLLILSVLVYNVDACFDNYLEGEQTTIKFDQCPGSSGLMKVEEIRLANALFNKNLLKSMFYVGEPIQICMKGRFTQDIPEGLSNLQNSVHGDVQLVGDLVKVKYPFCEIDKVGCNGLISPGCGSGGSIKKNDEFCYCSVLKEVPTSPDVNADVYWKILGNVANPNSCEKEFEISNLVKAGKRPLACVVIPARVKNTPPGFFKSQKAAILSRLG